MANPLRSLYRSLHRGARAVAEKAGLNVVRTADFYSPLPVHSDLRRRRERWDRPSELPVVTWDLEGMRAELSRLVSGYGGELAGLPSHAEIKGKGFGPGFPVVDGRLEYLLLRDLRPREYLEIGSGISTYYAWLALERNRRDGSECRLACVDPFPTGKLAELGEVETVASRVEDVDLELFSRLGAGDVLFIDSTHVLKIDGDVAFLFLEVLPRLAPGVLVHVHDIHFPYNVPYPAEYYLFRAKWPLYRTEAMVVQAFLCGNPEWEIHQSAPMLRHFDEPFLARTFPGYSPVEVDDCDTHFGSLWLRRRAAGGPAGAG